MKPNSSASLTSTSNPGSFAKGYVWDGRRLLAGRTKQIERLELWFDQLGLPDLVVVTKPPLDLADDLAALATLHTAAIDADAADAVSSCADEKQPSGLL